MSQWLYPMTSFCEFNKLLKKKSKDTVTEIYRQLLCFELHCCLSGKLQGFTRTFGHVNGEVQWMCVVHLQSTVVACYSATLNSEYIFFNLIPITAGECGTSWSLVFIMMTGQLHVCSKGQNPTQLNSYLSCGSSAVLEFLCTYYSSTNNEKE